MDLPKYNENAVCPMCHHGEISIEYCDGSAWTCPCKRYHTLDILSHFDRRCKYCGYAWAEATLARDPKATDMLERAIREQEGG